MTEAGGPTTQAGIFYQNSVAALALADLLELSPQSPKERVIEVRVEAPEDVDDVIIRYADGHRLFQNVKTNVEPGSAAWTRMWQSLQAQQERPDYRSEDRITIVFEEANATTEGLTELCDRAQSSIDEEEWRIRLTQAHVKLVRSIETVLGTSANILEILRRVSTTVLTRRQIESEFNRRRLGGGFALPANLLTSLRDIAADGGRTRALFLATTLRRTLRNVYGIEIGEPAEWGLPAYRDTIKRLARIHIPGTGMSGPADELFVWPRARAYDRTRVADFEDEEFISRAVEDSSIIDLRAFPSALLDRFVVVAGPGYGKSALMSAIAGQLASTPQVPVLIPLATLAASDLIVLDFLSTHINHEMGIRADWQRLAEQGLLVLLLDGLDEIPASARPTLLDRLATFSARFPLVPWMLSVRDPSALTGSVEAELIELLPLDDNDIVRFAHTLKRRLPKLEEWEFLERLQAYPDLIRLARIPLFLTMLLAMVQDLDRMPANRADLIEAYLKTLFAPHEHKVSGSDGEGLSSLRVVAEQLAFERLEQQEIGASEKEVLDTIMRVAPGDDADRLLNRLRANGVLRAQSSIRLQFPYPIVQEYLAACHVVREWPDTLASRIDDAIQRPWAQVIQFALELHPNPAPVIRAMLDRTDDAFATGLRLVGRCLVNGTKIDEELRREIERRLVSFWIKAPSDARKKVGRLLADGFAHPMSPELRAALHHTWLMYDGAGDILSALKNSELTLSVLRHLMDLGPKRYAFYFDLKGAVSAASNAAFELILGRVRVPDQSAEAMQGYADLLGHFASGSVSRDLAVAVALDTGLFRKIRLAATRIAGAPLDSGLIPLVEDVLRGGQDAEHYTAYQAAAFHPERADFLLDLLRDPAIEQKRRQELAGSIVTVFPELEARAAFIAQCRNDSSLELEVRWIMEIFAARYGDRAAFTNLIEQFPAMPETFVGQVISLFGHFREPELARRAVEQLRSRSWSGEDTIRLANAASTGMLYIYEMDFLFGGTLKTAPPHPGLSEFRALIENWADKNDLTETRRLNIMAAASHLGSDRFSSRLERKVLSLDPDAAEYDDDDMGHILSAVFREVRRRKIAVPLVIAERFVRSKRPNVPGAGISAIAAHANMEALHLLIRLHNTLDDWHERDMLANAIEQLAARLRVTIIRADKEFAIADLPAPKVTRTVP